MATSFFTRVSSGTGKTTVFARFQVPEQKIDYRASTRMEATIKSWTNSRQSAAKLENYKNSEEGKALYAVLDRIAEALDSAWANGSLTSQRMRELIKDIRNRDGVAREKADIKIPLPTGTLQWKQPKETLPRLRTSDLRQIHRHRDRRISL